MVFVSGPVWFDVVHIGLQAFSREPEARKPYMKFDLHVGSSLEPFKEPLQVPCRKPLALPPEF